MRVLVTGGLGYIGQHVCKELFKSGHTPIILDKKDHIDNKNIQKYVKTMWLNYDVNSTKLYEVFIDDKIDAVIHLAGLIEVGESEEHATRYYYNNVSGTINLLDTMSRFGVKNIVFASSAAVYGKGSRFVDFGQGFCETDALSPTSAYGKTKLVTEQIIEDVARVHKMKYANLRFFNVAGADPDGEFGECHEPETHIIPRLLRCNGVFKINGSKYLTEDGTCIRDYVHVTDLAKAHVQSLNYIQDNASVTLNIGSGTGYSNLEVVREVVKVTDEDIAVIFGPNREGDPEKLQSDIRWAKEKIGYNPQYSDLTTIVQTAYNWEREEVES